MSKSNLDVVREEIVKTREEVSKSPEFRGTVSIPNKGKTIRAILVVCLIFLGFIAFNVYQYFNEQVYIVNGTAQTMKVKIDDGKEVLIVPFFYTTVRLAQGEHNYKVTGEVNREFSETISLSWVEMLTGGYFYAINPGGRTILYKEETAYYPEGQTPTNKEDEYKYKYLFGEEIYESGAIDYLFEDFPASITVESSSSTKKTRIDRYEGTPDQAFSSIYSHDGLDTTLSFLEEYMKLYPKSISFSDYYASLVSSSDTNLKRGENYVLNLMSSNDSAPLYERAYQQILIAESKKDYLIEKYQKEMQEDPTNPDKLYLYGRILSDPDEQVKYYNQAIAIKSDHELSAYAKGYTLAEKGDFQGAENAFDIAFAGNQVDFGDSSYKYGMYEANGQWDKIIKQIDDNPLYTSSNVQYVRQKAMYFIAKNDLVSARQVLNEYLSYQPANYKTITGMYLDTYYYELTGEFDKIDPKVFAKGDPNYSADADFKNKITKGDYDGARAIVDSEPNSQLDYYYTLPLAIGYKLKGNQEQSLKYYNMALDSYKSETLKKDLSSVIVPSSTEFSKMQGFGISRSLFATYFALNVSGNASEKAYFVNQAEIQNYHPDFPQKWINAVLKSL